MLLLPEPLPPGCDDMSLLYLLISRTMSKKALSTLTRVLADVSMNLQPKCFARSRPSVEGQAMVSPRFRDIKGCRGLTVHPHLPLVFQIALVGNDDNWERVLVLHTQDLLVEGANFLKRIAGGDGVDQEEPLSRAHVLFAHSTAPTSMSLNLLEKSYKTHPYSS